MPETNEDFLITFGGAIKSLGDGRIGGYLVKFTDPTTPDLEGEYFDAATDYDIEDGRKTSVYLNHRQPMKTRDGERIVVKQKIGEGTLKRDEAGILIDAILYNAELYAGMLDKLGWSSGSAPHLVEYDEPQKGVVHISRWPLGLDASITPTPANPYASRVVPIKSLFTPEPEAEPEALTGGAAVEATKSEPVTEPIKTMEVKKMPDEITTQVDVAAIAKAAAEEAVKAYRATLEDVPPVKAAEIVGKVTQDEADTPFASLAAQCQAVKAYELSHGQKQAPRLRALKAIAGASEMVPADGGFLLDPTLTSEVIMPMHEQGPFSSRARMLPVSSNSNYGWINGVNETSRSTGSRWGGIRGYRLSEGDTKTSSKPAFRRINWELRKYAILVYGTDELLQDASLFSAVVQQGAREELSFMLNDDILNGLGVGGPLGILASGALNSVAREVGQGSTVVYENLSNMWMGLTIRAKNSPTTAWYINAEVGPELDALFIAAGTAGIPPRFVTEKPDGSGYNIKGKPVIETEFNAALGTVGDIVLSDMSEYLVWEKGGVQFASSIHVEFLTDQEVFRFVARVDGKPTMASTLTPYKATGTRVVSAHVALAAPA